MTATGSKRSRGLSRSGQRRLGFVASAAALLGAAPLSVIFQGWSWLGRCIIAVALVAGAVALIRARRAPLWAQVVTMLGALLLVLTWMFPSGGELLNVLPSSSTFAGFGELLSQAGADTRAYSVPVPDRDGLLFLTVLGVGGVAIIVDLVTVGLRRPALAGLPMLIVYAVPVAVYVDSVPPVPFIIGASGFLWLIAADNLAQVRGFGRRYTSDGQDVGVWEPSPLAAAGRRLTAVGVAVAVLVPLAVPGLTTGILSELTQAGASGQGRGGTGEARGVSLFASLSGQLTQSQTTDFLMVTTTEVDPFYLRIGVADLVSEQGFASRPPSGRAVSQGLPDPRDTPLPGVSRQQFRASVAVTGALDMPVLPTYMATTSMQSIDASWSYDPDMQVVYSNRSRSKDQRYEFDYVRSSFTPAALRSAPSLADSSALKAQLTTVPTIPEVQQLVGQLTRDARTDYDKVRAIYDHFSRKNGFSYSLSTESDTSGSQILSFLNNKVGFCQQYAASMAWLVRAANIPARVAFGFTRGEKRSGNTYVITNRNAHAWAEVYFDGVGWVPFDTTPAANVAGSARSEWAPDSDRVAAVTPTSSPTGSPQSDGPTVDPRGADDARGDAGQDIAGPAATAGPASVRMLWPAVTAAALVLILLALPAVCRAQMRRRRHTAAPAARQVGPTDAGATPRTGYVMVTGVQAQQARRDTHAVWDELIDTMIDYRIPVDPAETPRHTADRLVSYSPPGGPAAMGVLLLAQAEERARYARNPLHEGELGTALTDVRRAIAARASRRTRVIAAVLPSSVLLRWRFAGAERRDRLAGIVLRPFAVLRHQIRRWPTHRPVR